MTPGANKLAINKALKAVSMLPTAVMGHGNEGLFSSPGLEKRTKPGGKSPGPSIKNPKVYEALLKRGYSKERAARISNAMLKNKTELVDTRSGAVLVSMNKATANSKRTLAYTGELASTQLNVSGDTASKLIAFGKTIPDEHLHENGRDDQPHVTVHYGVLPGTYEQVKDIANNHGPISLEFNGTSLFTTPENFDVVKVNVNSDGLRNLQSEIAKKVPHKNERTEYIPHMTVAYVKKGMGKLYDGKPFTGKAVVDTLIYSDENEKHYQIKLGKLATKGMENAPNYRYSDNPETRCSDCFFYNSKMNCTLYSFMAHPNFTCDDFRPDENDLNEHQRIIKLALQKLNKKRESPYLTALRSGLEPESARIFNNSSLLAGN